LAETLNKSPHLASSIQRQRIRLSALETSLGLWKMRSVFVCTCRNRVGGHHISVSHIFGVLKDVLQAVAEACCGFWSMWGFFLSGFHVLGLRYQS